MDVVEASLIEQVGPLNVSVKYMDRAAGDGARLISYLDPGQARATHRGPHPRRPGAHLRAVANTEGGRRRAIWLAIERILRSLRVEGVAGPRRRVLIVGRNRRPGGNRFTIRDATAKWPTLRPAATRETAEPSATRPAAPAPTHRSHRHVTILSDLQGPADLRGLSEARAHPARGRDPRDDHPHGRRDRRPSRVVARRGRADDRPAPAAGVPARPDRLGHRAPGLSPQAADRPPRAVRRRFARSMGSGDSRGGPNCPTTCSTAGTPGPASRSPRASPKRATCATAWSASRSWSATRR